MDGKSSDEFQLKDWFWCARCRRSVDAYLGLAAIEKNKPRLAILVDVTAYCEECGYPITGGEEWVEIG